MIKQCQSCGSERVIFVQGHGKDLNHISAPYLDYEHDGYLPKIPNIGFGDDVEVNICLECGQTQGEWPVSDSCLLGFDDADDFRGLAKKEVKKLMKHYKVGTLDEMFRDLQDDYGGDTIEESLASREEHIKEAKKQAKK